MSTRGLDTSSELVWTGRKLGYLVAIAINLDKLIVVKNIHDRGWLSFLTAGFVEVPTSPSRRGGMVGHSCRSPFVALRRTLCVAVLLAVSACGGTNNAEVRESTTDPAEPAITCAAESTMHDDGIHRMYVLESGVPLECTVTGLVADVVASWDSELYDEEWADHEEPVDEQGGLLDVVNGEAAFATRVPDHPPLLSLVTRVSQGEVDVYVFGSTALFWLGRMACTPDPATEGETVACIAEDLTPDEPFSWMVLLHDEKMEQVDLTGTGRTDGGGTATFSFEVPTGGSMVGYAASTEQGQYGWAEFSGTIK